MLNTPFPSFPSFFSGTCVILWVSESGPGHLGWGILLCLAQRRWYDGGVRAFARDGGLHEMKNYGHFMGSQFSAPRAAAHEQAPTNIAILFCYILCRSFSILLV